MSPAEAEALVPLAAELVGTVRDFGPDAVADVLARVPANRHDALAVVLAAMVDPDQSPSNLLAWTTAGPVQSREGFDPTRPMGLCGDCGRLMAASSLGRHQQRWHAEAVAS